VPLKAVIEWIDGQLSIDQNTEKYRNIMLIAATALDVDNRDLPVGQIWKILL
jgi:hypothetical protein